MNGMGNAFLEGPWSAVVSSNVPGQNKDKIISSNAYILPEQHGLKFKNLYNLKK